MKRQCIAPYFHFNSIQLVISKITWQIKMKNKGIKGKVNPSFDEHRDSSLSVADFPIEKCQQIFCVRFLCKNLHHKKPA